MAAVAFAVRIIGIYSFGKTHIKFFRFHFADLFKVFQRERIEINKVALVISGGSFGSGDVRPRMRSGACGTGQLQ